MDILIVGGGVAGLTLAAKLRQQGRDPVVVEKAPSYRDTGYAIGLYPLGSCVLHGLNAYEDLVRRSLEVTDYEIADHKGTTLQNVKMQELTDAVGPLLMLPRTDLIEVLRKACGNLPILMGTTVEGVTQREEKVEVEFSDGTGGAFDLVVGCEGIHSALRAVVAGPGEKFDTGWICWTWWGPEKSYPPELVREYWGRGWFFSSYPVPGKRMFCAILPRDRVKDPHDSAEVHQVLRSGLKELFDRDPAAAEGMNAATYLFAWPMYDIRTEQWSKGRLALCGDSGMAFLPTAGVGASNALRSAASLADELSRADARQVPLALELYQKRCYEIVKANQQDSRRIGELMFLKSNLLGWSRDQLVKHVPASRFISSIIQSMKTPL